MSVHEHLQSTIDALVAPQKGILAADESLKTITKRFQPLNIDCTDISRRDYREMLFTTPNLHQHIAGVILFEETLTQVGSNGKTLGNILAEAGIMPGIKVDKGLVDLPFTSGEKITQGLDDLKDRLATYQSHGARFAKWRAVISIDNDIPSQLAIDANAHALARYAAICQAQGIVPIVEPEVLMDGDHTLARCEAVTERVLHAVFRQLNMQRVILEQMILKPSMVIPGKDCAQQVAVSAVAAATLRVLLRAVPAAVPTINFLSGGQSDALATQHLNAMNQLAPHAPWQLSFSYGRALQHPSLEAWAGNNHNRQAAQEILFKRARLNGAAVEGKYQDSME